MAKKKPIKNPLNIHELFNQAPVYRFFSSRPLIPTQLKMILRANPEYEVQYATGPDDEPIKVQPKVNILEMMRKQGMAVTLRGVGFTRKSKKQSKKNRKMSQASRRRNR